MTDVAPIVFIVFNRPDHTQQVLDALKQNTLAKESLLYVFSDAPRSPKDEKAVEQVRSIVHQITGFKQVLLKERPQNMGCSGNVLSAINTVLSEHERCIVVEDDIVTAPIFLEYMNKALHFYEQDEAIFSIGAYRTAFKMPAGYREDVFLLNRSCSWGWATWRKAWNKISVDPEEIKRGLSDKNIRKAFAENGEDLLRTYEKHPEIWDLRVSYGLWRCGLHTVFPIHSLTHNIGKDGSGEHYDGNALKESETFAFPSEGPRLTMIDSVDKEIRKAFQKYTHKPLWRVLSIKVTQALGLYHFLLRKFDN
jgi:hypothetical protein